MLKFKGRIFMIILILTLLLITSCKRLEIRLVDISEDSITRKEKLELNKNKQIDETESKNQKTKNEYEGVLLMIYSDEWIFLDDESIMCGEDRKMECDLDGDGVFEYFSIGRESPNGTKILAVGQNVGYNLVHDVSISDAFEEFGHPINGYGFQVTCFDLDNDGIKEVILSTGNQSYEMESIIYRYTKSIDKPFELVGHIEGQTKMYIEDDGTITAPFGSQGLFTDYKYLNKNLYKVEADGGLTKLEDISKNYEYGSNGYDDNGNYNGQKIHIGDIVSAPGYMTKMLGEVLEITNGKYKVYWFNCIDLSGAMVTDDGLLDMSQFMSGVTLYSTKWCEGEMLNLESSAYW